MDDSQLVKTMFLKIQNTNRIAHFRCKKQNKDYQDIVALVILCFIVHLFLDSSVA